MKNFWIKKAKTKKRIKSLLTDLQDIMALQGRVFKLYGRAIKSMKLDGDGVLFEIEDDTLDTVEVEPHEE